MPNLKATIDIDAPREHVFAAADPLKMPEWTVHIKEVIVLEGDGRSAGTKDKTVITVTPRKNTLLSEWTEYKPGEAWARTFHGYLSGTERIALTEADGGTRLEWTYNYTPPFGVIGKIGALLVMSRVVLNNMESSLDTLKRELEI
ncbi:MAG TPA: SRPBCC family protein [Dehalococcoidia bacterium]|nr:SRPBCC family protein [Dehalococcoidia bacterium]